MSFYDHCGLSGARTVAADVLGRSPRPLGQPVTLPMAARRPRVNPMSQCRPGRRNLKEYENLGIFENSYFFEKSPKFHFLKISLAGVLDHLGRVSEPGIDSCAHPPP